ncbi:MAG: S-methyl-5-thioribose-1-phosphate isomerase [Moorellales bacterium]
MPKVSPLFWAEGKLHLLDQNRLPHEVYYHACSSYKQVAQAIRDMTVRGAPAIGIAAAFGVVLAGSRALAERQPLATAIPKAIAELGGTRPTAVNLFWALERMQRCWEEHQTLAPEASVAALEEEAKSILQKEEEANQRLSELGATLVPKGARILTHCNAGALATAGYGTALGVVRAAHEAGKVEMVYADETRPRLQGARLTAWELSVEGIPVTVICDNMAAWLMAKGKIDLVIVGADRIAANGDVANKVGTYALAIVASYHRIPFYVAAPTSTIDLRTSSGREIPIEERPHEEVSHWEGRPIHPAGVGVANPAFDVTPAELVRAIITEKGILRPPYGESLQNLFSSCAV